MPVTGSQSRTVLEQQIRARRMTFEEFAEFAETFARQHGEVGTLSARHLQRLAAGSRKDGRPVRVLPSTARLLEAIFHMSIEDLLSRPDLRRTQRDSHPLRVVIAVVVKGSEVLLVRRRSEPTDRAWQFPAGMVKPGAMPEVVAVRETLGETGVHCAVRDELGSRLHPITNVLCDYVLCDYVAGHAENADEFENVDVRWVGRDELERLIPADQIYRPVLDALELSAV